MPFGKVGTQHVEAREHPAGATALLVVYALLGRLDAEIGVYRTLTGMVLNQIVNVVRCHGINDSLIGKGRWLYLLALATTAKKLYKSLQMVALF